MADVLRSPRANLRRVLNEASVSDMQLPAASNTLMLADAENKFKLQKLYLVVDLDETLVYSQRLEPGARPKGHVIHVRGQPFDVIPRPGLQEFLRRASSGFVLFLYTMGDEDYIRSVLEVVDPTHTIFIGGICCWRPTESRQRKTLSRPMCDPRMSVIIDDSFDVWSDDLANVVPTRRFTGNMQDEGLRLLQSQLEVLHTKYFTQFNVARPQDISSPESIPDIRSTLSSLRGRVLEGCNIAVTGIISDQTEQTLETQPLCMLVRMYGGSVTLSVDACTHLVARKKEGWQRSTKLKRAIQRQEAGDRVEAVWDAWLLDAISSWQRPVEKEYNVDASSNDEAAQDAGTENANGSNTHFNNARNIANTAELTDKSSMRNTVSEDVYGHFEGSDTNTSTKRKRPLESPLDSHGTSELATLYDMNRVNKQKLVQITQ